MIVEAVAKVVAAAAATTIASATASAVLITAAGVAVQGKQLISAVTTGNHVFCRVISPE